MEVIMLAVNINQHPHIVLDVMNTFTTLPIAVEIQPDQNLEKLLPDLSHGTPRVDRKNTTRKSGNIRFLIALTGLLGALPANPFWKVRCAIIKALEMTGDPRAIPALRKVARYDGFQVVRSHASKAIERLYQKV
jgi:HEAT repeat protein